jgi:hypothetical protein
MPAMITRVRFTGSIPVPAGTVFQAAGNQLGTEYVQGAGWFDRCDHNLKELKSSIFGGGGIYVHRNWWEGENFSAFIKNSLGG